MIFFTIELLCSRNSLISSAAFFVFSRPVTITIITSNSTSSVNSNNISITSGVGAAENLRLILRLSQRLTAWSQICLPTRNSRPTSSQGWEASQPFCHRPPHLQPPLLHAAPHLVFITGDLQTVEKEACFCPLISDQHQIMRRQDCRIQGLAQSPPQSDAGSGH